MKHKQSCATHLHFLRFSTFLFALSAITVTAYAQTKRSEQAYAINSSHHYYQSIQAQDYLHTQIQQQALENQVMQQKITNHKLQRQLAAASKSKGVLNTAAARYGHSELSVSEISQVGDIWEAVIWFQAKKYELSVGQLVGERYKVKSIHADSVIFVDLANDARTFSVDIS
ncbi:hypothetical protein [Cysteiniphilum halobium]|uniref:hypothetical protein n=1 Tax=Cysteiniphilum halobium TaxID=2219059 RepID=UPI000E6568B5|nr:hypothetical protein [Cysteiniphilum halobium]